MGYNLRIGEYDPEFVANGLDDCQLIHNVEHQSHENAPAFGEPTDHTNSRLPTYPQWEDFCIHCAEEFWDVFSKKGCYTVMPTHPGVRPLCKEHLEVVRREKKRQEKINPKAGYEDGENQVLVRILWLEYWIDWALNNCERPVFVNT